jgi:pimeloyl-ACP methyl ester carboxylesterase
MSYDNTSTSGAGVLRAAGIRLRTSLLIFTLVVSAACSTGPVSVKRLDPAAAYSKLSSNALSSGEISSNTSTTLRRHDLLATFEEDPERAIAELRAQALAGEPTAAQLSALGETSFAYGMATDDRAYFLAAAVYAYALLFPESSEEDLSPVDPRVRIAVDGYNIALGRGFASGDGETVELKDGRYELPFGVLNVSFDDDSLVWAASRLADFIPADELEVKGLRNRYRRWGIGAALAARAVHQEGGTGETDYVAPNVRVPVTALLRIDNARKQLVGDEVDASLKLYTPTDAEEVHVGRHTLPLQAEPTAALAVALAETRPWRRELRRFLGDVIPGQETLFPLVALNPPRPDRIPVIFVHGTYSSRSRWANMANDLLADRIIRERFDLYFFAYDSGNPIAFSGLQLRTGLDELYETLRIREVGECADHMVVIGHSQGGLLTKMTVVDSGDAWWNAISSKPFEDVRISPRNRKLVHDALFFDARPYVDRVVFIATPHQGSYLAGSNFARRIASWLISVPTDIASIGADMLRLREDPDLYLETGQMVTSIDNMAPGNRGLSVLAGMSIKKGVAVHSIIPVKNEGPLEEGRDGVVAYTSAHIEGVDSELVVRSSHSCQDNPYTINEVQRILLLHAESTPCGVYGAKSAGR